MKKSILLIIILLLLFCNKRKDYVKKESGMMLDTVSVTAYDNRDERSYKEGVNDALTTIMLHDLELKLQNKNMTWGERADTVRKRLIEEN